RRTPVVADDPEFGIDSACGNCGDRGVQALPLEAGADEERHRPLLVGAKFLADRSAIPRARLRVKAVEIDAVRHEMNALAWKAEMPDEFIGHHLRVCKYGLEAFARKHFAFERHHRAMKRVKRQQLAGKRTHAARAMRDKGGMHAVAGAEDIAAGN